jgi:cell division protein FtsQ
VTQTLDRPAESGASDASVDPRIQARRDQVDRERAQRRRRRTVVAGLVVATLGLAWLVVHSPLLAVRRVEVTGTPHVPPAEVRRVAGIATGQHLVGLDAGAARARLLALPWVADARVRVDWGGTVRMSVTERRPVAAVAVGPARWMLVDASGRALGLQPAVPAGLMPVRTPPGSARPGAAFGPAVREALEVTTALRAGLRSRVTAVVVGSDASLSLGLRPTGVVHLCSPDQLTEKLAALTTVFAHVDDQQIAVVDACIPDLTRITRITTAPPTTAGHPG